MSEDKEKPKSIELCQELSDVVNKWVLKWRAEGIPEQQNGAMVINALINLCGGACLSMSQDYTALASNLTLGIVSVINKHIDHQNRQQLN